MSAHQVVIGGVTYRPGDVALDANGKAWQVEQCISASGENTVGFMACGQPAGHLTYYPPPPLTPMIRREVAASAHVARLTAEERLVFHSVFAYPHFWLWHALFDGTRLCGCWHSREMRDGPSKIVYAAGERLTMPVVGELRTKTDYAIPGLEGTWRIMGLRTTDMGADGQAQLDLVRVDPPPVFGGVIHSKECGIRDYPTCTDGCHGRQDELRSSPPTEHSSETR